MNVSQTTPLSDLSASVDVYQRKLCEWYLQLKIVVEEHFYDIRVEEPPTDVIHRHEERR